MGKAKPNRRNKSSDTASPTGLLSLKQAEAEKFLAAEEHLRIDDLVQKLTSSVTEDKVYACTALAISSSNKDAMTEILKKDVVRTIASLLTDSKTSVQATAINLLRSLSDEGGFEACEVMVRHDVLSSLAMYLRATTDYMTEGNKVVRKDGRVDCIIDTVMTIQNLCECTAVAVKAAVEESIPELLLRNLSVQGHAPQVYLAAAQCLYTLSEDNELVTDLLRVEETRQLLASIIDSTGSALYTKVVVAGVLCNVSGCNLSEVDDKLMAVLYKSVGENSLECFITVLQMCCRDELPVQPQQGGAVVNDHTNEREEEPMMSEMDELRSRLTPVAKKLEVLDDLLQAQKLSFEILTNLTASDDSADQWQDVDDDNCSDISGAGDVDMEDDGAVESSGDISTFTCQLISQHILPRLQFIDTDMYSAVESMDRTYKATVSSLILKYHAMLASSLTCLNNCVQRCAATESDSQLSVQLIIQTAQDLLARAGYPHVSGDDILLESLLSAVRGITERFITYEQACPYDDGGMNVLHSMTTVNNKSTAIHAVRTLAAIGMALSKSSSPHPTVKIIGQALIEVAMNKESWVAVEALDSIMDVFSEDINNQYMSELSLLSILKTALPQLKALSAKRDASVLEFLPVLTTVKTNLPRFIKYKSKQGV